MLRLFVANSRSHAGSSETHLEIYSCYTYFEISTHTNSWAAVLRFGTHLYNTRLYFVWMRMAHFGTWNEISLYSELKHVLTKYLLRMTTTAIKPNEVSVENYVNEQTPYYKKPVLKVLFYKVIFKQTVDTAVDIIIICLTRLRPDCWQRNIFVPVLLIKICPSTFKRIGFLPVLVNQHE